MSRDSRGCENRCSDVDRLALGFVVLVTAMLASLSVMRYRAYNASMFDIGHMTQAIWSVTQGRPLEFSYRGDTVSRLALHVELVYFLLTPLFALFPSPVTLLVTQAVLFGAGSFPLYRLARRRVGSRTAARFMLVIYLLYPMAQSAVLFDLHGDTLAMPLLLFAFDALDRQAWRAYGIWMFLALSCKAYVAASVCVFGAFLWLEGRRRVGMLTAIAGLLWGILAFLVVRPLFAAPGARMPQSSAVGYVQFYFGDLLAGLGRTWWLRLVACILVFAPVIPVLIYALDWGGLVAAIAAPTVFSSGPGPTFAPIHHRYAVVVSFLMLAVLEASTRLGVNKRTLRGLVATRKRPLTWREALATTALMTLLMNVLLISTPLSPWFWLRDSDRGWSPWTYMRTSRDALKDRWLTSQVPDDVALLASPVLASHLAQRQHLHTAVPLDGASPPPIDALLDAVDYVVLDGLLDFYELRDTDLVTRDWATLAAALSRPEFDLVSSHDGLLLLARRPATISDTAWADRTLPQTAAVARSQPPPTLQAAFGDSVGLVDASITYAGNCRYRLQYAWSMIEDLDATVPLFAVTQLVGVENSRILHVPTVVLHPTTTWEQGDVIHETFEADLPDDLASGEYVLTVGWYDSGNAYAYATDERSRVGALFEVGLVDVR